MDVNGGYNPKLIAGLAPPCGNAMKMTEVVCFSSRKKHGKNCFLSEKKHLEYKDIMKL